MKENKLVKFVKENKTGLIVGSIGALIAVGAGVLFGKMYIRTRPDYQGTVKFLKEVDEVGKNANMYIPLTSDMLGEMLEDDARRIILDDGGTFDVTGMIIYGIKK